MASTPKAVKSCSICCSNHQHTVKRAMAQPLLVDRNAAKSKVASKKTRSPKVVGQSNQTEKQPTLKLKLRARHEKIKLKYPMHQWKKVGSNDCDVTSAELLNCNGYIKHFIKKQANGICSSKVAPQKCMKAHQQAPVKLSTTETYLRKLKNEFCNDLNNISTSTKKQSTCDLALIKTKPKKTSKRKSVNARLTHANTNKRQALIGKPVSLKNMPFSFLDDNQNRLVQLNAGNGYFQSACLNKFNQLGQFQVWYV